MAEIYLLLTDATRMPYILLQMSGNTFQMHSKINSQRKYREIQTNYQFFHIVLKLS